MDAREREDSQSRRPSIKRPWEEESVLPEQVNVWKGTRLPPIDASYRRPSLPPRFTETEDSWENHYGSESSGGGVKRSRYEGHDHNTLPQEDLDLKGTFLRPIGSRNVSALLFFGVVRVLIQGLTDPNYTPTRSSQDVPSFRRESEQLRVTAELGAPGASENVSLTKACPSCKGLIMQGSLGDQKNDSAEVLKLSASLLNNTILVLTRFMPEARGAVRVSQWSRCTSCYLALLPLLTGT